MSEDNLTPNEREDLNKVVQEMGKQGIGPDPGPHTTLPVSSAARKEIPLYEGLLKYFPAALVAVARVSKVGNDKHNPGQPLHHARGKSTDHPDCIIRHLLDLESNYGFGIGRDETGVPQVAYIAWRALALAQEWLEKHEGVPLAPGAVVEPELIRTGQVLEVPKDVAEAFRTLDAYTARESLISRDCICNIPDMIKPGMTIEVDPKCPVHGNGKRRRKK